MGLLAGATHLGDLAFRGPGKASGFETIADSHGHKTLRLVRYQYR